MKLQLKVKGTKSELLRIRNEFNKATQIHLEKQAGKLVDNLQAVTPKKTGYASSRWVYRKIRDGLVEVLNDAAYIMPLNRGHSRQAPAFFIEGTPQKFGFFLGKIVKEIKKKLKVLENG